MSITAADLRRWLGDDEKVEWNRADEEIARVDDEQSIGVVRQPSAASQHAHGLFDRLRLAKAQQILGHEPRRRVLGVRLALLDPGSIAGIEHRRNIVEHVARKRVREVAQIVGVELAQHASEPLTGRVFDERGPHPGADLDESLAAEARRQLAPDDRPVVGWKGLEQVRDIRRMQTPQSLVQLNQVLTVLHLFEQRAARRLLPPRDGLEHAVLGQQAVHFGQFALGLEFRCVIHGHWALRCHEGCWERCTTGPDRLERILDGTWMGRDDRRTRMRIAAPFVCTVVTLAMGWSAAPSPQAPTPAAASGPQAAAKKPGAVLGKRTQFLEMFARAYFPGRNGQVMVVPREGAIITRDEPDISYMHGSPWPYDTAIPLFFAGAAVQPGMYGFSAAQQDVAVTIASLLQAAMPPTVSGRVLPILRPGAKPPRAVLIVVLDGMRPDYFTRYASEMPTFSALRQRSAWMTAARINVLPTNTAVGHSTIATGADPRVHGITGNNLYDATRKARHDMLGGYNPRDLVAPTVGDVWQLQTGGRAIVIGQGSSLPASTALAGHGACQLNGVKVTHSGYDEKAGRWRTNADCFTQPASVAALDASTLFPPDGLWMGHKVASASDIRRSGLFPRFETDAFVHMIESQPVGQDEVTDVLLLNYKGADYIGHKHGPTSPEMAATLSEMDRGLARILQAVEERTAGDYLARRHRGPWHAVRSKGTARSRPRSSTRFTRSSIRARAR